MTTTQTEVLRIVHELLADDTRAQICEVVACMAANGVSMADTHAALLALQEAEQLVLYRNDYTASLRPVHHRTALLVNGCPRHLVYVQA
jgi:hypothetical protein